MGRGAAPAHVLRCGEATALSGYLESAEPRGEPPVVSLRYRVLPRAVVVLLGGAGRS
jgi:hypothetical protein